MNGVEMSGVEESHLFDYMHLYSFDLGNQVTVFRILKYKIKSIKIGKKKKTKLKLNSNKTK